MVTDKIPAGIPGGTQAALYGYRGKHERRLPVWVVNILEVLRCIASLVTARHMMAIKTRLSRNITAPQP